MSIATELTLLANSKQAIKNSINQKGGSITDSTPFADYSTAIDNLPSGGDNSTLIDLIEGDITTLNIPSGTTMIGNYSIANKPNLTSVTIPNSVTRIKNSAFQSCSALTSITIPNSVTSIENSTFSNCTSLTSVTIPSGVTSIEGSLFYSCTSLENVTIPSSVTIIKTAAFYNCSNLKSLTIPSTVTQIGESQWGNGVFSDCRNLTAFICLPTTPPTAMNLSLQYANNYIYVPAESVDAYKAASGWSSYASRIYPIAQVATVDNTPVYNYDLGMTSSTTMITSTNMQKMPAGTSLELAEGIIDAGGSFGNYTSITLPSTFTSFDDQDMIGSSATTLTMKSTTPPTAERDNFGGAGLTAIYVPASAVDTYKAASGWSNFASIIQAIPTE